MEEETREENQRGDERGVGNGRTRDEVEGSGKGGGGREDGRSVARSGGGDATSAVVVVMLVVVVRGLQRGCN